MKKEFNITCPIPISQYPTVLLAHGGGGKLMHDLIQKMIAPAFKNSVYVSDHDSAVISPPKGKLAFTTDSFVVRPLFFPGGDIGRLAVFGTVNDLAMSGARPLYLSLGFILEEGLPMETLWRVIQSIKAAAAEANVHIVTGDTKVVDKGKGDGIFINTSGVGVIEHKMSIEPASVKPGDILIINGDLGRHGMAIMSAREGLEFESPIQSDAAPLASLVTALIDNHCQPHCLRDLTRGGLASALNEIAESSGHSMEIEEEKILVSPPVKAACELLGFDPYYVANEGRFVGFFPPAHAEKALSVLRSHPLGEGAAIIGRVTNDIKALVIAKNSFGTRRILDMLSGEQLPRIC